jgi:hypothetical protein
VKGVRITSSPPVNTDTSALTTAKPYQLFVIHSIFCLAVIDLVLSSVGIPCA